MFGFKKAVEKNPIEKKPIINWSVVEIYPSSFGGESSQQVGVQVGITHFGEYCQDMIANANCTFDISLYEVLVGVLRIISAHLEKCTAIYGNESHDAIMDMYDKVILRENFSPQMLLDALFSFKAVGAAIALTFPELIRETIPSVIIPLIKEGQFNE